MDSMEIDFSSALLGLKNGKNARRRAWKNNKVVCLKASTDQSMSYLEIAYTDGTRRRAPWVPTRCDILEEDWIICPAQSLAALN